MPFRADERLLSTNAQRLAFVTPGGAAGSAVSADPKAGACGAMAPEAEGAGRRTEVTTSSRAHLEVGMLS